MTAKTSGQDRAVDALLELLTEKDWSAVTLGDIAAKAGMSLAELRAAYPSKGAILSGFARRIDQSVLKPSPEIDGQPARERLFDVMMRRFEALKPYKAAIRSARRGLLADPVAASSWNKVEVNSAQWMLAAAGIEESGAYAAIKAQGLAVIFASLLGTFLDDDDPDLTKTMRELDVQLRRAERLVETGDIVQRTVSPVFNALASFVGEQRKKRSKEDDAASAV
ncbi:TetR/AcrR family transcriptional regulator [Terrihabitans soli]|uniref:TetR/AcrR family transcriptional regulator n=1 Tax=Terrihabitans soli TaxID=708113 RepID=UPI001CA355F2|nr:TetR/AcrR family transcriptional regulator [Terrihabitans soli]